MRISKELEEACLALESPRRVDSRPHEIPQNHNLIVEKWHPTKLNTLMTSHHMKAHRLKKADKAVVAFAVKQCGIPKATMKRRVTLRIQLAPRQRGGDPDAYWKSLLDALTDCGMLKNDSRNWCELGPVEFDRGKEKATIITLEDLRDDCK